MRLLRTCLRVKQDQMFAMMKKCVSKEGSCEKFLEERLWKRIAVSSVRDRARVLVPEFVNLLGEGCL
ncbi:hypothetical protein Y032_0006g3094 [Ancylostoma ceylanicum]|uniref:Uncharacterized protein n=1 Tax=Ancylostoma ceylanicum TaxID=53326 RepID=A0A016VRI5_9BILA|nr:hypothetical protein Y032_0006g3094 [Ancylostoma ceylanicum]